MLPSHHEKMCFFIFRGLTKHLPTKKKNSTSPAGRELNITSLEKVTAGTRKSLAKKEDSKLEKNRIIFRFQPLIFSGPGLSRTSRFPGGKWAALDVAQKASLSFSTLPAPMGDPQSWVTWSKKSSGKGGWWWMIRWDWKGIFVGEICYCDFFGGEVSLFKMICWL